MAQQSMYFPVNEDYSYPEENNHMDEDQNTNNDMEEESAVKKLKPWEKVGPDGRPIKRKPNPAKKNAVFRRALQPKSSIMCLNELQSGLKYVTEPVATIGNFCVSVEVNGQTFRGYGSSKDLAKQAAAEAALVSFVKPPPPKPAPGEAPPKPEDDTTPWRTLASFAMYKLFSDWRDGRIGVCNAAGQQGFVPNVAGGGVANANTMMHALQGQAMAAMQQEQMDEPAVKNVNAHLQSPNPSNTTPKANKSPREKKVNTEAQQAGHPVMILHQLVPIIKYENEIIPTEPGDNTKVYNVTAEIEGQLFTGQGTSIKVGKFHLAKEALKVLYDIDNVYVSP